MLDTKLLAIIVCPACKAKLDYDRANNELLCKKCRLAYPILDDIPVMLVDKAREIDSE